MKEINSLKICFVSNEIWPGTGGGIGRLISENARLLAEEGFIPVFLLDVDNQVRDVFLSYARKHMPEARVYTVDGLLSDHFRELQKYGEPSIGEKAFGYYHYWRSYLIDLCLQHLLAVENPDGIEFADYLGQGYVYFKMRPLRESCASVPAWVRLHGSAELCDAADGKDKFSPDGLQLYDMERYCLARCDRWVAPSSGVKEWYGEYYGLDKNCLLSAPAFQRLGPGCSHPRRKIPGNPRRVLFYGKLQRLKGVDLLVQAALMFLRREDPDAQFLLVGPDVPAADGYSTQLKLEALIPAQFRDNFIFRGKIEPVELPQLAAGCDLAVIPSRVETFCLAAHELNWIGIPLLVNDIPGLAGFFVDGENCLKFKRTAEGIYQRLKFFYNRPEKVEQLQWRTPEPDMPVAELYRALCSGTGGCPAGAAGTAQEPPVAVLSAGADPPGQSLPALDYSNLVFEGSADRRARFGNQGIKAEYCIFLPPGSIVRPEFLPLAIAMLEADPRLAGVTCFAAVSGAAAVEEKYIIACDLNKYLIFIDNVMVALPVLWRCRAVAGLCPEDFTEPGSLWAFLGALAAEGKVVGVLPRVLAELTGGSAGGTERFQRLLKSQAPYLKKNFAGVISLFYHFWAGARSENRRLSRQNNDLRKNCDELWAEVKKLGADWEEQRKILAAKEEVCAQLWGDLSESRRLLEDTQNELKLSREKMNSLLSYLENKKIVRLISAAGLLDIKPFGEG